LADGGNSKRAGNRSPAPAVVTSFFKDLEIYFIPWNLRFKALVQIQQILHNKVDKEKRTEKNFGTPRESAPQSVLNSRIAANRPLTSRFSPDRQVAHSSPTLA
jgi:hypothetical protein